MSIEKIKYILNKNNYDFYYMDRVESTMSEIKKFKLNRNICLMANQQTKGIGRRGAKWESPKGNVFISILSKNLIGIHNHFLNNAFTTNVICNVIERICNVKTQIKWPNDILINDRKISGIISEIYNIDENSYINTGLGINIISSPVVSDYITTNINEYRHDINNLNFTIELMSEYFKYHTALNDHSNSIMEIYKSRLKFLGSEIKLMINEKLSKKGIFYDLNYDGSIILKYNSVFEHIYNARIVE